MRTTTYNSEYPATLPLRPNCYLLYFLLVVESKVSRTRKEAANPKGQTTSGIRGLLSVIVPKRDYKK